MLQRHRGRQRFLFRSFRLFLQPPVRRRGFSNSGEESVYLDVKKAGWKDDCLFIFGIHRKEEKERGRREEKFRQQIVLPRIPPSRRVVEVETPASTKCRLPVSHLYFIRFPFFHYFLSFLFSFSFLIR